MDPFTLLALTTAAGFIFKAAWQDEPKSPHPSSRSLPPPPSAPSVASSKHRRMAASLNLDEIEVIPYYRLALEFIRHGGQVLFVTGGAGTGKSTFIK
jgi:hypothetical protein